MKASLSENGISFLEIEIKKNIRHNLTIKDAIILLCGANPYAPIETRTVFYKELFLLYKEVLSRQEVHEHMNILDPEFVPYIYGPFSFIVASDLGELVYINAIKKEGKKNNERFTITQSGKEIFRNVEEMLLSNSQLDWLIPEVRKLRHGWDQLGRKGLRERIDLNYPEYFLFGTKNVRKIYRLALTSKNDKSNVRQVHESLSSINSNITYKQFEEAMDNYFNYEGKYEGLMWAQSYKE